MSDRQHLVPPAGGLVEYRDELVSRMNRLPFSHRDRGRLADTIRQIEAAIDRFSECGPMSEVSIDTVIVGTGFKGMAAKALIAEMRTGEAVQLRREPHNPHDTQAVACHYRDAHVGYIPRQANPRIAEALDARLPVTCTVRELAVVIRDRNGFVIRTEPKLTVTWRVP